MRHLWLAAAFLSAACATRSSAPAASGPAPPPPPAKPAAVDCPAALDLALEGQPCVEGTTCAYPDGECSCTVDYPCSGVAMTEEIIATFPDVYACTTTDPARRRADGCFALPPSGACDREGQSCRYGGDCGGAWAIATCTGGAWTFVHGEDPPPP